MKRAIFCTSNLAYVDTFNVFVNTFIDDLPSDVDLLLFHTDEITQDQVHPRVILRPVDVSGLKGIHCDMYPESDTQIMAARIKVLDMIRDEYDWILYFDTDIAVQNINAFLEVQPTSALAAVRCERSDVNKQIVALDYGIDQSKSGTRKHTLYIKHDYFNSGMMIFDAVKLREYPLLAPAFIEKSTEYIYEFPDQDFFNIMFEEVDFLDYRYNCMPLCPMKVSTGILIYSHAHNSYLMLRSQVSYAVHYVSQSKPWCDVLCRHRGFQGLYFPQVSYDTWFSAYDRTAIVSEKFATNVSCIRHKLEAFNTSQEKRYNNI